MRLLILGGVLDDGTGAVEAGNVLMDNRTGTVLGFIGEDVIMPPTKTTTLLIRARHQGSTIKPILAYGIAIDQGLMGRCLIMLSNYPANFL